MENKQTFEIDSLEKASWAFKKIRERKQELAKLQDLAEKEKTNIDTWLTQESRTLVADIEHFETLIQLYFKKEREENPKFKLTTPFGKISTRKSSKLIVDDENVLKDWIKANDIPALKIKEEIDKSAMKKLFAKGYDAFTGEVVPGMHIEETENMTIKVE